MPTFLTDPTRSLVTQAVPARQRRTPGAIAPKATLEDTYAQAATSAMAMAPTRHALGPTTIAFPVKYGIELEMDGTNLRDTRLAVAGVLGKGSKGQGKGVTDEHGDLWQVKPDESSLVEVASPVLKDMDGLRKMQDIAAAAAARGAIAHAKTGTHFHVDAREMDVPHVIRLVALLARHERHLYHALGVHKGRARYCMPMDPRNVARLVERPPTSSVDLCKLYRGPLIERDRGMNVENLLNRGSKVTLEFRYFNGTLSPHVLGCYAGLVMGLTAHAMASRNLPLRHEILAPPDLPHLFSKIGMAPEHPTSTLLMNGMLAAQRTHPRLRS